MTSTSTRNPADARQSWIADPIVARAGGLCLRWRARALRGDRTIAEAARMVDLNRDELSRIEKGETIQIRFETLAKLLVGYNCELSDLVEVVSDVEEAGPGARPLYAGVLDALEAGVIERRTAGRRAVRRSPEVDILVENDEARFAPSPVVRSARHRAPVGTANRPR
jgi:DNA-binding Xre family transcriptional regulator